MLQALVYSDTIKVNSTYLHMAAKILQSEMLDPLKSDLSLFSLSKGLSSEVQPQCRVILGAYSSAASTAKL